MIVEVLLESLIFSLHATVPIFLIILFSYWLNQRNFFPEGCIQGIDRLVFHILIPIMLFLDMATTPILENFDPLFSTFCFVSTVCIICGIWGGTVLFCKDKHMIGAFVQASYRSSVEILGIALTLNIYGDASMVPQMIVAAVPAYNILAVVILTLHSDNPPQGNDRLRATIKGILTNPIMLGIFCGLPFSLLHIPLPEILYKSLDMLGACGTPLALVVIGASFEGAKALQKLRPTLVASAIKLVILPAITLPIAYWLGFRDQAIVVLLILAGSPTTVSSYIMAKNLGNDHVLTASVVMLTTILSALTLTFFLYLLRAIGAV